ncbi:hypothetical protein AI3057V1_5177 (plasmid) [Citrobacter freundii]|uniref:hypothetical protein n=1 Tax=Citrobacter freundii TaxID=546 RepID=UPI001D4CEEAD|nr:hypothetical protein [Citrobacter freundii]CAG0346417.1 hypothetical protein AI3057V1_5177 [Citrobacter freundii]CAH6277231.1 hypothetical protein AI3057V1_5177 [Citrobacter freundii]
MSAFRYSARHANAVHVLERLLNKEQLGAHQIRVYDDQGRVIEYINNKLLVPVERMKIKCGDEHMRVWYLTDQTINDFYYNREQQYRDQLHSVVSARQHRKAVTAAGLLASLGEAVPESIKQLLAANDDY